MNHRRPPTLTALACAAIAGLVISVSAVSAAPALAATPTTTSLSVSPEPSMAGPEATVVITVAPNPGGGIVDFRVDGDLQNSLDVNPDTGVIKVLHSFYQPGTFELTASFRGTSSFDSSTSDAVAHHVKLPRVGVPWFDTSASVVYPGDQIPVNGGVKPAGSDGQLKLGNRSTFDLDPETGTIPPGSLLQIDDIPVAMRVTPQNINGLSFGWSAGCPVTLDVIRRPATPTLSAAVSTMPVQGSLRLTLRAYGPGEIDHAPASGWSATLFLDTVTGSTPVRELTGIHTASTSIQLAGMFQDLGPLAFHYELEPASWWMNPRSNTIHVDVVSAADQAPPPLPSAVPGAVPTQVTLTADQTTSSKGDEVVYTAIVTPNPGAGFVGIHDGSEPLSGGTIDPSTGIATIRDRLRAGDHVLRATFGGTNDFAPSRSDPLSTTVEALPISITITSSANPSLDGGAFTVTATISPTPPAGSGFQWNGSSPVVLDGSTDIVVMGPVTYRASDDPYPIQASLTFDGPYADARSNVVEQVIGFVPETITLDTPAQPIDPSARTTFHAHVSPAPVSGAGDVLFVVDGGRAATEADLSGGLASGVVPLTPGHHSVQAFFSGGDPLGDATSAAISVDVLPWADRADIHGVATINEGGQYADVETVQVVATLDPDSAPVTSFQLSNDGKHWATFGYDERGGNVVAWSITDAACGGTTGDGGHTVYYRFANGDQDASPVASTDVTISHAMTRSLVLDRIKPRISSVAATQIRGADGRPAVRFGWSPTDDRSGVARSVVQVSVNGSVWSVQATKLGTRHSCTLADAVRGSHYRFRVRAFDRAGNASAWKVSSILTVH